MTPLPFALFFRSLAASQRHASETVNLLPAPSYTIAMMPSAEPRHQRGVW